MTTPRTDGKTRKDRRRADNHARAAHNKARGYTGQQLADALRATRRNTATKEQAALLARAS